MNIIIFAILGLAALLGLCVMLLRRLASSGKQTSVSGLTGRAKHPRVSHYCSYPVYSKKQVY